MFNPTSISLAFLASAAAARHLSADNAVEAAEHEYRYVTREKMREIFDRVKREKAGAMDMSHYMEKMFACMSKHAGKRVDDQAQEYFVDFADCEYQYFSRLGARGGMIRFMMEDMFPADARAMRFLWLVE